MEVTIMGNKTFSKEIKKIRTNRNLTMEQLANFLGVTKSSVNMWENKGVVPREEILRNIAEKFNISLDTLLGVAIEETENQTLSYIQRNIGKLDDANLKKAETLLRTVFDDIFEAEDEDEDDF
jgi:transcriptional regulator with XRE-family HTH domain